MPEEVEDENVSGTRDAARVRRIGEYDLLASLGRGGAGEVSLALRRGPHDFRKLVVIKLLHAHFQEDPEAVEMFLDEARLAGRLDHPGIVQTHEVGVSGDRHFMVMSYLEGLGLDRLLAELGKRGRRMPESLAAWITAEVLGALHYAHELADHDGTPLQVVHRDVSPSNVFLCWDGSVKLLDFGIAKAAIRRANTDSGIIKGKWSYIAPEHATGEGTDRRADVWSAGVVLWEMLTGRRLFPNLNDVTTLQALVAGELPDLHEFAPEVSAPVAEVVDGALQHDPDTRFGSAEAMAEQLRTHLADLSRPVRREDLAELLGDLFEGEREAQQVLLADLVGGALSLSRTGSFVVSEPRAEEVLPRPEPAPAKGPMGSILPLLLAAAAVAALTMIAVGGALSRDEGDVSDEGVEGVEAPDEAAPEVEAPPAARLPETHEGRSEADVDAAAGAEPAEPSEPSATDDGPSDPVPQPERGLPTPTATPTAAPALDETTTADGDEAAETPEAAEPGYLFIDTIPWSRVRIGDQELGTTPLVRVELPAGEHTLTLENPESGLVRTETVWVRPGATTRRRIPLAGD